MKTRMKFKYAVLTVLTLLAAFSGCSNDDERESSANNTPKSLFLKIKNDALATYAEGVGQGSTPVVFSFGDLYFTDAAGVIKKHYTISTAATSLDNINMAGLTGPGETIANLPGDVSAVYIVGNTSGLPTTGNISVVKRQVLQVQSQGNIAKVNLYGEVTALTPPIAPATYYTCTVNLAPTVARLELADITAGGVITGFKVAGIFVDNYYSQATVNGAVLDNNLKNNGPSASAFDYGSIQYPNTPVASSLETFVYDWFTPSLIATGSPLKAQPVAANSVWGYNVFAAAGSTGSAAPRIIIRLKDITTTAGSGITYSDDQFLTIKLKKAGTVLDMIKAGEVYNIGSGVLKFDETNLTPTPNLTPINISVNVSIASWVPVSITPDM